MGGMHGRCEPTTIKIVGEVDKYKCTEIDQKMDSVGGKNGTHTHNHQTTEQANKMVLNRTKKIGQK